MSGMSRTKSLVRRTRNTYQHAVWGAGSPFISRPDTYSALDAKSQEIRLLEVAPGEGDDILVCRLKHVHLLDIPAPIYETISYCWGPPKKPSVIRLDGKIVRVTESSVAALRRMRLSDQPRVLWIDAICINQSSNSEKSEQVAIMSIIYSTATRNLVHLGENGAHLAERALRSIRSLNDEMAAATDNYTSTDIVIHRGVGRDLALSTQDFSTGIDFEALEGLFKLPWFTRLWVLQEASLASSSTCHWGAVQLDLLNIARATLWLAHKILFIPESLRRCNGYLCAFSMGLYIEPTTSMSSSLSSLMATARMFEKQEPRDSVYAIIGIPKKYGFPRDDDVAPFLMVDYSRPLSEVLRDATRCALIQRGEMLLMQYSGAKISDLNAADNFPSWTFRPDIPNEISEFMLFPRFFTACNGLEPPSSLRDVSRGADILLVEGLILDHVAEATATYRDVGDVSYPLWLMFVKGLVMRHFPHLSEEEATSQGMYTVMASTLAASQLSNGKRAESEDMEQFGKFLNDLKLCQSCLAGPQGRCRDLQCHEECSLVLKEILPSLRVAHGIDRRFFVTQDGVVGLGPSSLCAEDLVVVLRGGYVPFILRPSGEFHKLIGPAYVHGAMDGEAVETCKARNQPEVLFAIR